MNFRQLDLNLLRVLAAIHRTRSVTAAGKALSLSQSATSNALARLRHFFDDELFVRSPAGLQPTRLCERVAPAVLAQLRVARGDGDRQGGLRSRAPAPSHWKLSLSDLGEMLFLPPLAAALRRQAPHARACRTFPWPRPTWRPRWRRGRSTAPSASCSRATAACTPSCSFASSTSPSRRARGGRPSGRAGRSLSPAQLAQASLVVASPTATFHSSVEQMLARMKLADRIVLRARHFGALPELAHTTDLLAIVPDAYAKNLGQRFDLKVWQLPGAPFYDVRLCWHASSARSPAHQWMRTLMHRLFARPASPGAMPDKR